MLSLFAKNPIKACLCQLLLQISYSCLLNYNNPHCFQVYILFLDVLSPFFIIVVLSLQIKIIHQIELGMKPYPSSMSPGDTINTQLNYTDYKRYSPFQDMKSQRQKDHKLQFSKNHGNSVNSSDLIFKARQIYEKYRHPQSKQTYCNQQSNYFPQLQPQIDSKQSQRHEKYFKLQNANTSSGSSFKQEQQRRQKEANHFKRQVVTASTVPSTTSIQAKRPEKELERFQDFLYMLVGVLSSHIRINQRLAFKRIAHYQISVKKDCQLIYKTNQIHKRRIKQVFILLSDFRKNAHTNMKNYPINNYSSNQQRIGGQVNNGKPQNLILEQSTVEKGLKFLQDRASQRKQLQEMMMSKNVLVEQKRKVQIKNEQILSEKPVIHQNPIRPNQKKEQVEEKNTSSGQYTKTKINDQEDVYLRLERKNKNDSEYKVASWINRKILDEPFQIDNKRELFDRNQINQRRHYLNPCLLKQAEPDLNNQFFIFACAQDYELRYEAQVGLQSNKKLAERTTSDYNYQKQHEGALPIFDPKSTSQSNTLEQNQHQIGTWQNNKNAYTTHNQVPQTNSQYDSQQFQHLPSFNDQNRNIVKNQQNLVRIDSQQGERERRRSDLGPYKSKSRQSSFKNSEEGEEFIDECQQKHNFKKAHKVQQYFTDNVLSHKSPHVPHLAPLKNKLKRPSRPKSMTHSANSYDNFIVSLQKNMPQKPQIPTIDTNRPIIRISYESPRNQTQAQYQVRNQYFGSPRNLAQNLNYQSDQLRHPTLIPRQSSNSIFINKPLRAVSSQARFVGNAHFQINRHAYTPQVVHYNANQISFQVYPPQAQQNRPYMVQSVYTPSNKNIIQNYSAMAQYGIQPKRSPAMTYSVPIIQPHPQLPQWHPHPQIEAPSKQQILSKKGISVSPRNREHEVFVQQNSGTHQDPLNLHAKSPKVQRIGSKKKINVFAAEYF